MDDKILDGKALSKRLREELKLEIEKTYENTERHIKLAIIQVGDNPASNVYVRNKTKACEEVGIICEDYKLSENLSTWQVMHAIVDLNSDPTVDGILVQLPLPEHIDQEKVLQTICPEKDVDCFNYCNFGKICIKSRAYDLIPCTPLGIITLLEENNIDTDGKECVIVGRSNIVGRPLANILSNQMHNATVTIAHSHTKNLKEICKRADILISAIGKAKYIDDEYIKEGAVVIDVGMNRD